MGTDPLSTVANAHLATAFDLLEAAATIASLQQRLRLYQVVHTLADATDAIAAGRIPHWPHAPSSEQWTTRNGAAAKYLYLYWSRGRYSAGYDSPKPRGRPTRKTYIGVDPANVALARALIANYHREKSLSAAIRNATSALSSIAFQAGQQARNAAGLRLATTEALEEALAQ